VSFGGWIQGGSASASLSVENGAVAPADSLNYSFAPPAGFTAPGGAFVAASGAGPSVHALGMNTASAAVLGGTLDIISDAPDAPIFAVTLSGTVFEPANPSVESDVVTTLGTIDFGTHEPGGFTDVPAIVYNVDHHALRAETEVYDATLSGDSRFSFTTGFAPARAGASPASWDLHFDDAGSVDGEYTATLVLHTQDASDLNGFQPRADLTYSVVAIVDSGVLSAGIPAVPLVTGFASISPNPFRPSTQVSFGLRTAGNVKLRVYDVAGRSVRTLVNGHLGAGNRLATWNGRDDAGRPLAAGTYYLKLEAPDKSETRAIVRTK
jgi:hypothetical protein